VWALARQVLTGDLQHDMKIGRSKDLFLQKGELVIMAGYGHAPDKSNN
jgi:hypothetical protein